MSRPMSRLIASSMYISDTASGSWEFHASSQRSITSCICSAVICTPCSRSYPSGPTLSTAPASLNPPGLGACLVPRETHLVDVAAARVVDARPSVVLGERARAVVPDGLEIERRAAEIDRAG